MMLTEKQCPYTGPLGLPSSGLKSKSPTCEALKRGMSRLGLLPWTEFDDIFNQRLADALARWDPGHTGYGKGRWEKIRKARVPDGLPHVGEYALDTVAQQLIRQEHAASQIIKPTLVYPIPGNFTSKIPTYLHPTGGIPGNWALDWMAAPSTPVIAPEDGTVSRTSGNNPASGVHGSNRDVFGWSIYLRCKTGFYYSTHYGRLAVSGGSKVKAGQIIGYVGDWPRDRGRSHLHLGFTSFTLMSSISKRKIQEVAAAPRVTATL